MKHIKHTILPPGLENNPSYDVIVTERTPLLSFFNAKGGPKKKSYQIQLDISPDFDSKNLIEYADIPEKAGVVSDVKIRAENQLLDGVRYYWRARAITTAGKSEWAVSRFYVDTKSDKAFMNLVRTPIKNIEVSAGYNKKNIIDWDDPGLVTFWQSPPPGGDKHWVVFDFGKTVEISRAWILSNPGVPDGWLKDFDLQISKNKRVWKNIKGGSLRNNDTFRNIIDFKPIKTRFLRILIKDVVGYCAQINEVIIYSPGKPKVPKAPKKDYVLVIGNEHNGYTFTDLKGHLARISPGLEVVAVPYFEASMQMLRKLSRKPVAIILSGNNADYPNLPMFEHNGEFEIIRQASIPILGICAGHQFLAMAYGYTRARSMGWSDITAIEPKKKWTHINILKKDPIFAGVRNKFTSPEIHGWAVADPADEFVIIGASSYVQVQKSIKRLIYGLQFHAEIKTVYNQARFIIKNFLNMALRARTK